MELFHALNRGVEGRDLFAEEIDYVRFVHNLYAFNDSSPADTNLGYFFKYRDFVNPYIELKRELLVDIHGWCLMRNHYHLLLSERIDGGISRFLRKLNVGYANYFNEKYERDGTLFQGRTKKIAIRTDAHYNYILHYIHLNPLDYLQGSEKWRLRSKNGIASAKEALAHLASYRWSSYPDYAGKRNFPSILFPKIVGERSDYLLDLQDFLKSAEEDSLTRLRLE